VSSAKSDACAQPPADRPLAGLTVVELGHSVAAPFGGQVLADLGARVVKIEKPELGDDARCWGPPFWHGASSMFQAINRNKLSAAVDLKDEAQRSALLRFIVDEADIVLQNMRAGLLDKLGLGADALRAAKSSLIICNLSAFGAKGPLSDRPGYDPLMQAFGGIMSITGEPGRPPVRTGPSIIDQGAGMWAVIGILSALHRRGATGDGAIVDTSLLETALSWMNSPTAGWLATGNVPGKRGSEQASLVPYKVFTAADGDIMIACGNDNLFRRLATALGRTDWLDDSRFASNPDRVCNRDVVNAAVQEIISTRTVAAWSDLLERAGVPAAPLQTVDQVAKHPQTEALGILQPVPGSDMTLIGLPLSFDGTRPPLTQGPPKLGEHTGLIIEGDKS
jgi:crotonobetainyl-CoA:carnitine CoA-transferase CaiB-like acyl-CoA transferase